MMWRKKRMREIRLVPPWLPLLIYYGIITGLFIVGVLGESESHSKGGGKKEDDGSNATLLATGNSSHPELNLTGDPRLDYVHDPNLPHELKGYDLSAYPFFSRVPKEINFPCDGLKDGFYANKEFHCQIYHHCLFGHRYDFLCANYTAFDQRTFICQFVSDVDCQNSHLFHHRNDDLYWENVTRSTPAPAISPEENLPRYRPGPREAGAIYKRLGNKGANKASKPHNSANPSKSEAVKPPASSENYSEDDYYEEELPPRRQKPRRPAGGRRIPPRRRYYPRRRTPYYYYDDEDYDESYDDYYYEDLPKRRPGRRRPDGKRRRRPINSVDRETTKASTTTTTQTTTEDPTTTPLAPLDPEVLVKSRDELFSQRRRATSKLRPPLLRRDKSNVKSATTTTTTTTSTTVSPPPAAESYDYYYYEDELPPVVATTPKPKSKTVLTTKRTTTTTPKPSTSTQSQHYMYEYVYDDEDYQQPAVQSAPASTTKAPSRRRRPGSSHVVKAPFQKTVDPVPVEPTSSSRFTVRTSENTKSEQGRSGGKRRPFWQRHRGAGRNRETTTTTSTTTEAPVPILDDEDYTYADYIENTRRPVANVKPREQRPNGPNNNAITQQQYHRGTVKQANSFVNTNPHNHQNFDNTHQPQFISLLDDNEPSYYPTQNNNGQPLYNLPAHSLYDRNIQEQHRFHQTRNPYFGAAQESIPVRLVPPRSHGFGAYVQNLRPGSYRPPFQYPLNPY